MTNKTKQFFFAFSLVALVFVPGFNNTVAWFGLGIYAVTAWFMFKNRQVSVESKETLRSAEFRLDRRLLAIEDLVERLGVNTGKDSIQTKSELGTLKASQDKCLEAAVASQQALNFLVQYVQASATPTTSGPQR